MDISGRGLNTLPATTQATGVITGAHQTATRTEVVSPTVEVPKPVLAGRIWHDKPVFKIQFKTAEASRHFKAVMLEHTKGIDLEGKVRFDADTKSVEIFYFPRIARALIPREALDKCSDGGTLAAIESHADSLGSDDLNSGDPHTPLFAQMSAAYNREQEIAFAWRAKAWESTCQGVNLSAPRPQLCKTQFNASHDDHCKLWEQLARTNLVLGESHLDDHQFLKKNLAYFGARGYDTLFLEGVHAEAQSMLDAWVRSTEPVPSPELKALLGDKVELVVQAKAAGIRVVGIDSEQTYVVQTLDRNQYIKTRTGGFNDMAHEIIKKQKGPGKFLVYVGEDHALRSKSGVPGIAAVLQIPAVILRNAYGIPKDKFCLLSGSETFFSDLAAYDRFSASNFNSVVECPLMGHTGCDIWIEASPDANWSLGQMPRQ
jgi:hypothetical protein